MTDFDSFGYTAAQDVTSTGKNILHSFIQAS